MRKVVIMLISFFSVILMYAQNTNNTKHVSLAYKPPSDINGLTLVNVDLNYKIVNVFGDIHIVYEAECKGNLGYQYQGKEYTFSGNDDPVRDVRVHSPIVKVRITGPNYNNEMLLWVSGMGGGVLGDSNLIKTAKTDADKILDNYKVTAISVESVSFDNAGKVQSQIEKQLRDEKRQTAIDKAKFEGDNAMNEGNFTKAKIIYSSILTFESDNSYAKSQLRKIEEKLKNETAKKRYDDAIKSAQKAEEMEDYSEAKRFYEEAAQENVNNNGARYQADRIDNIKKQKIKQAEDKAKAIATEMKSQDEALKESDKENEKIRQKLQENDELAKKALAQKMDSLQESLELEERNKLITERKTIQAEQDRVQKIREKEEDDQLKEDSRARRSQDQEIISRIEKTMHYDAEAYANSLEIASKTLSSAENINPYESLILQKEWWDNNPYIQLFADDLYEKQRQENHAKYMKKTFEKEYTFEKAKQEYLNTMYFVDKNSEEQEYLLTKIEYCNKRIDSFRSDYKTDYNSERIRQKQRNDAKLMAEGQRIVDNREKARMAYATLQSNSNNQAQYLVDSYKLSERMESAHQQYLQDAAITGVSQSIIFNLFSYGLEVKENNDNYMFNFVAGIEYNSVPILMNSTSDVNTPNTTTESLSAAVANIGLDSWFYRSKYLDVNLGLSVGYGVYPSEGYKVSFLHYNGKINADFGYNAFKIATLFQFLNRTGKQTIDNDVAVASSEILQPTATNTIKKGEFDYNILRFGAGLKIGLSQNGYANLTGMVIAEKPSFYKEDFLKKPIITYSLQFNSDNFGFAAEYAPNYVIAGKREYPLTDAKNLPYFTFKIIYAFSIL